MIKLSNKIGRQIFVTLARYDRIDLVENHKVKISLTRCFSNGNASVDVEMHSSLLSWLLPACRGVAGREAEFRSSKVEPWYVV